MYSGLTCCWIFQVLYDTKWRPKRQRPLSGSSSWIQVLCIDFAAATLRANSTYCHVVIPRNQMQFPTTVTGKVQQRKLVTGCCCCWWMFQSWGIGSRPMLKRIRFNILQRTKHYRSQEGCHGLLFMKSMSTDAIQLFEDIPCPLQSWYN